MSEPGRAARAVRDATRRLARAAEIGDPALIDALVAERAHAVEDLAAALDGSPERAAVLERVALDAAEAEAALRSLAGRARQLLDAQARGLAATRGYASGAARPAGLDRRG